jgi:hypothetical protein
MRDGHDTDDTHFVGGSMTGRSRASFQRRTFMRSFAGVAITAVALQLAASGGLAGRSPTPPTATGKPTSAGAIQADPVGLVSATIDSTWTDSTTSRIKNEEALAGRGPR